MSDIDKRLTMFAKNDEPDCDCGRYSPDHGHNPGCSWVEYMKFQARFASFHEVPAATRALAAALLRARKNAQLVLDIKCYCGLGYYEEMAGEKCFHELAKDTLANTELEEALG